MAPEHRPDRPLRNRRARRGAGGLSGRTGGRQRPRRRDHRRRTRAPGRVMAGDRTSVPLPLGGRRRRDRPRLRGPGSARQQPTPAHGRIPTADEQRHRRPHALLLPRLRRRGGRHHGAVLRRGLGRLQPPRCRLRPLRTRGLGRQPAHSRRHTPRRGGRSGRDAGARRPVTRVRRRRGSRGAVPPPRRGGAGGLRGRGCGCGGQPR